MFARERVVGKGIAHFRLLRAACAEEILTSRTTTINDRCTFLGFVNMYVFKISFSCLVGLDNI